MSIIVSGCTGSIGAAILDILLSQGIRSYALVRGAGKRQLPKHELLTEIEADISKPSCGLSAEHLAELCADNIQGVIHSAGLVKFDQRFAEQLHEVNVGGTKRMLDLAKRVGAKHFHHISTAYVVGEAQNPYEESKQAAEKIVEQAGENYTIYRPSIVVGDSKTGQIRNYDGFYGFSASLRQIVQSHLKRSNLPLLTADSSPLHLPINIPCCHNAHLNLISVDWVSQVICSLLENPVAQRIIFLAHPQPMPLTDVFEQSLPKLGLSGINLIQPGLAAPTVPEEYATYQKLADRMLKKYLPYTTEGQHFPVEESFQGIPSQYWQPIPMVDGELLSFLLDSAIKDNFGKLAA